MGSYSYQVQLLNGGDGTTSSIVWTFCKAARQLPCRERSWGKTKNSFYNLESEWICFSKLKKELRTSLGVQGLRILLPMQETQV